jgi:hypothetical protein
VFEKENKKPFGKEEVLERQKQNIIALTCKKESDEIKRGKCLP